MSHDALFPRSRRFDDRILTTGNDGRDFEDFTRECFQLSEPELKLGGTLTQARDGAIDLVSQDNPRTVVECKHIGAGATSRPGDRWREVERHLEANLIALADGQESGRELYKPWLNSERPISEYRFCTSALAKSLQDRDELRSRITFFFRKLAKQDERLSHLAHMAVLPVFWDDFHSVISSYPSLRYRWFGSLPVGLALIGATPSEAKGFKEFLTGSRLPYLSRALFAAETQATLDRVEDDWLATLQQGSSLLIYGPGGVGKTRLALEICHRSKSDDWLGVQVGGAATIDSLETLLRAHPTKTKFIFFVDYGESTSCLAAIAELARDPNRCSGHDIRLVVTCRSSSWRSVADSMADLAPEMVGIGIADESVVELEFAGWVTRRILAYFGVPNPPEMVQVCDGLPVLAAFASFLFVTSPDSFDRQFGHLIQLSDFQTWIARRCASLVENLPRHEEDTLLVETLASLPLLQDAVGALPPTHPKRHLCDRLLADRWIEAEGSVYVAAHDILADMVIARHIFSLPGLATNRLEELIELAVQSDTLLSTMVAINRLATYQSFAAIHGLQMVRRLLGKYQEAILESIPLFFVGRLLSDGEKISLLAAETSVREKLKSTYFLDGVIGYLAEWASKNSTTPEARGEAEAALHDLLVVVNARSHTTNMMLRRSFAFEPTFYRDGVYQRLGEEIQNESSQHLIGALLRADEPLNRVEPLIHQWLIRNGESEAASFVINNWLRRDPDLATVEPIVKNWLRVYSRHKSAAYVMSSWLRTHKPLEAVLGFVLEWIDTYPNEYEAGYLYWPLLKLLPDPLPVQITDHTLCWLTAFAEAPGASWLFRAWLTRPLDPAAIAEPFTRWLTKNIHLPDAAACLASWMPAGGDFEVIREFNARLDVETCDPMWAAHFLANWLTQDPHDELARDRTFEWFSKNLTKAESALVSKKVAGALSLPITAAMDVMRWGKLHRHEADAISRVSLAFHGSYASDESFPLYLRLLADAVHAIISFEETEPVWSSYDRVIAGALLSNLATRVGQNGPYSRPLDMLITRAIASKTIFRGDTAIHYCPMLVLSLKRVVQFGGFEFKRADLAPFLNWIRATADEIDRKGAERILAEIGIAL